MRRRIAMIRTRVKICGITRPQDALAAAQCGADAIGLVFYAPSPRCVTVDLARQILAALPPFISVVGLFVNPSAAEVERLLVALPLDLLQFHGDEPPEFCAQFGRRYLKAIRVRNGLDLAAESARYAAAAGLLYDAYDPFRAGGTGAAFDWRAIPAGLARPWTLAGGLHADNVQSALALTQPYAVDVSSGVEAAQGIKDPIKIQAFIKHVREFDAASA